jgi:hypothetical protein
MGVQGLKLFDDDLIKEYQEWRGANPESFSWWSYVNMKSDLQTALAFAKFFSPELIEIEGCLILKDKYDEALFKDWVDECKDDKTCIEKMMNIYELNDFFHINRNETEYEDRQFEALGDVLKHFWSMSFKHNYPNRNIIIDVFKEMDERLFITVYEQG